METHLDLFYTNEVNRDQSLDLFCSKILDPSNKVLLVFIHGGLWVDGDKSGYHQIAHRYWSDRVDVAIINYR